MKLIVKTFLDAIRTFKKPYAHSLSSDFLPDNHRANLGAGPAGGKRDILPRPKGHFFFSVSNRERLKKI